MTTLTQANREWSSRAADERFSSLVDLDRAARGYRDIAASATATASSLSVKALDGDIILGDDHGAQAQLTNWSFAQLASIAGAPTDYVSKLPARIAADCLNEGLRKEEGADQVSLLFNNRPEAGLQLRAVNSPKYARIWNSDITTRLLELEGEGVWQPAPEAFDGSRGLYMGDRDMFTFMVDNNRKIFETKAQGLSRGFFLWNSEVGARSFGIMTFLYEYACGNHRVWGASEVNELRISHIGNNDKLAFSELEAQLLSYAEGSASEDEAKIQRMMDFSLGANKEEILNSILGIKNISIGKRMIEKAVDLAETREDWYGNPRSAWGMGGALTEIARDLKNANDRVALERASSRVMDLAVA